MCFNEESNEYHAITLNVRAFCRKLFSPIGTNHAIIEETQGLLHITSTSIYPEFQRKVYYSFGFDK